MAQQSSDSPIRFSNHSSHSIHTTVKWLEKWKQQLDATESQHVLSPQLQQELKEMVQEKIDECNYTEWLSQWKQQLLTRVPDQVKTELIQLVHDKIQTSSPETKESIKYDGHIQLFTQGWMEDRGPLLVFAQRFVARPLYEYEHFAYDLRFNSYCRFVIDHDSSPQFKIVGYKPITVEEIKEIPSYAPCAKCLCCDAFKCKCSSQPIRPAVKWWVEEQQERIQTQTGPLFF